MDLPEPDASLVARLKRGDTAALDEFLLGHRGPVFGYLRARLVEASAAEDLARKVFLHAYRVRATLDGDRPLRPRLIEIACGLLREHVRASRNRKEADWATLCLDLEAAPETLTDETLARLPELLDALDPSAREAIELKYRAGGTLSGVAERLRRSESAARLLLFRARQALVAGLEGREASSHPGGSSSDAWLVALLDEKSPAELTPAELAALRERAHASPELRAAIAAHLRLEGALHARFGEPNVTAESILRRVATSRRARTAALAAAILLTLLGAGAAWRFADHPPRGTEPDRSVRTTLDAPPTRADAGSRPAARPVKTAVEAPKPAPRAESVAATQPAAAVVPAPPAGPWSAALADDAPVVPFEESAFAGFGETVPGFEVADELPAAVLSQWLAPVPGRPFNVNEGQWRGKRFAGLEGAGKLLAPWRSDAVLRLATFDVGEFALQLWNGRDGYLIRFYPQFRPQVLAAYAVTRDGADPTPKTFRLAATDGGSYSRANAGAIELRHQDGRLVVTRGAVTLLVLPMADRPAEVFLDGRTRIRSLAMYRGEPAPLPSPAPRRDLLPNGPPDALQWITSTDPPAQLTKAGGKVTLSIDGPAPQGPRRAAWAAVKLPAGAASGICEAVFRLDGLTPGAGLYLGDADGIPVHTLFASENTPAGAPLLAFGWTSRDGNVPEPRWRWDTDPKNELAPTAGGGTWVKLLLGPGGLKTFFSTDGEHWGPAARDPQRNVRGSFASVGVFAIPDGQPRSITLSAVSVRELSGLAPVADPDLRRRVPALDEPPPSRQADWLTWVMATRPGEVPLDAWLRACAVETLARSPSDPVATAALDGLIRDAIDSGRPAADVIALLHDAALLADLWDNRVRDFAEHYESLARRVIERGGEPDAVAADLLTVAEGYLAAPIWTETRPWALPPAVVRNTTAIAAWSPGKGPAASRRLAAYLTPGHPDNGWSGDEESGLARLAAWAAEGAATRSGAFDSPAQFVWRHPLATEPGREGATVAAELEAALAAGAYDDAARLTATLADLTGLVPATADPNRFLPPAAFVAEAASRHPDLVKTLAERFGPAGLIRVRQAAAAGDEAALAEAAVRFFGTPAASEAHLRLGEAALADGRFGEASAHFAAALAAAPEDQRPNLVARRRLAAALAGEEAAEPPPAPIALGPQTLDPAAFEQLVGDLRQARATASQEQASAVAMPAPVAVKAEARGRFEGDVGRNPGRGEFRRFDWAGRQVGVTLQGSTAYLTNRFQLVAFDLDRRAPAWAVGLGGEQGEAHALPNAAFKPLFRDNRLYVRRLAGRAPELACLATAENGKLLWRSPAGLAFASDPLFDAGSLVAVTYSLDGRATGPYTLALTRVRLEDGASTSSTPLLTLNDVGEEKPYATLTSLGNGYLVTTWGTAARCDADGNLAWVRKLPHLPAPADPDFDRLAPDPPLLADDRAILASPGSRAVFALDLASGRLLWARPLGELERLSAKAGEVAIVRSGESLLGLDPATGGTKWTFRRAGLLEGTLCDERTVLATTRTELENRTDALSLLRLDAATGRLTSEQIVRVQREDELRCGPLFVHAGTVWGLLGESTRDPKRTLVEFAPEPSAPPVSPAADPGPLADWIAYVEPPTSINAAVALPGWTPIGWQTGNPKKGADLRDDYRGERGVLVTESNRDRAARFLRTMQVPTGPSKLIARVGREDDAGWTLRLLADGKPFASEPIDNKTAPDAWRTVTFDLSPLAGRTVALALDQAPPAEKADKATTAFWKSVAIE